MSDELGKVISFKSKKVVYLLDGRDLTIPTNGIRICGSWAALPALVYELALAVIRGAVIIAPNTRIELCPSEADVHKKEKRQVLQACDSPPGSFNRSASFWRKVSGVFRRKPKLKKVE